MDELSFSLSSASGSGSSPQAILASTYRNAAKLFVNRRFQESLDTVEPLLDPNSTANGQLHNSVYLKAWNLYLALVDSASKAESGWEMARRQELMAKVNDGTLWSDLDKAFITIPQNLFNSMVVLISKYGDSQAVDDTFQRTELYLSSISMDAADMTPQQSVEFQKLLSLFVFRILPIKADFEYAREFISISPFFRNKQEESLSKLDQLEKERTASMLARQTRKEQANNTKHSPSNSSSSEESSILRTPVVTDIDDLHTISPASTNSNGGLTSRNDTTIVDRSTPTKKRPWTSITQYWYSRLISHKLNSIPSISLLIFLISLLSLSNQRIRAKIKLIVAQIWAKIIQTLTMGFKVSYI